MNFSASGLRQVALQFETDAPKLKISKLISAPNLEHLELEFPSISNLAELSLQLAPRRQDKPFRMTVVSSKIPKTSPRTLDLDWRSLEKGFGPQDYTNWPRTGADLHHPLVRESERKHKWIYCNRAYTAAARAQTPRLAAAPQTCSFKLLDEEWMCEECEEYRRQKRVNQGWYDRPRGRGHGSLYDDEDSENSDCFPNSDNEDSFPGNSEDEYC